MVSFDDFSQEELTARARSFELLADGWYLAQIIGDERKLIRAGGEQLSLTIECISRDDGDESGVRGRRLFTNLMLWHPNPDVRSRARSDLQAIADACGLAHFRASEEFRGIPIRIKVRTSAATEQFEARNEIKAYKRRETPHPLAGVFTPAVEAPASTWTARPIVVDAPAAPAPAPAWLAIEPSGPTGDIKVDLTVAKMDAAVRPPLDPTPSVDIRTSPETPSQKAIPPWRR